MMLAHARPAPFPLARCPLAVHEAANDWRVIVIERDCWNVNLRTLYESRYGPPNWFDRVRFVMAHGVTVRSRSARLPAIRTGYWPERPIFGGVV